MINGTRMVCPQQLCEANSFQVFEHETFGKIRVVMKDGEPWFVAKDVAEALEYAESSLFSINTLIKSVPEAWKWRHRIATPFGSQKILCLSEHGLYLFLDKSKRSNAPSLRKWVFDEIIPSIRKAKSETTPKPQQLCEANSFQVFEHETFGKIKVIMKDGEPWLVANDVAEALGHNRGDVSYLTQYVPEAWKGRSKISCHRGAKSVITLSEQGLTFLFNRSNRPNAPSLRKWVFDEIIPSMRKAKSETTPKPQQQLDLFNKETKTVCPQQQCTLSKCKPLQLAYLIAELLHAMNDPKAKNGS